MHNKITFILFLCFWSWNSTAQQKYSSNWESLQEYNAPEWYEDAKIGFWVHWGVYSVPAFKGNHAAEWYGRWMYCQKGQSCRYNEGLATHLHHYETYGSPKIFGYKDLIPMFTAEKFDAENWANLCVRGGAKFFTMMATHHDSFCQWNTKLSKWNSVHMGPKRDLVGEIEKEIRKKDLHFGVSNHSAWNYCFFQFNHINRYDATDIENQDLYGNPIIPKYADTIRWNDGEERKHWLKRAKWDLVKPSERDISRFLERTKELGDLYHPDLYYFDWGINHKSFDLANREFASHFYNEAIQYGQGSFGSPGVVINHKGAYKKNAGVRDFERGGNDDIADQVWQTDDCVYDDHNWGFVEGTPIKSTDLIVDELMDIISKRGILMLSFAPRADGSFPDDQKKLMFELGDWLKICGEAVYNTRPYQIFGERREGASDDYSYGKADYIGTDKDFRFTRNKENNTLYITALDWSESGTFVVKTLAKLETESLKKVSLLGSKKKVKWEQTEKGLVFSIPYKPSYHYAYPIKLEFIGDVPTLK